MKKKLSNIVGPSNVSDNPLDLEAYSYCSSETQLEPQLVVWPGTTDQVGRVILYANQTHTPIIIRGSGTSLADGCIGENMLILSSERMNKIIRLDLNNKIVEVEAGIKIKELNDVLSKFKMTFPFTPLNPTTTIGGMIALDTPTKESRFFGSIHSWLEEIEFIDGTAKHYYTKKKEAVLGKEGLSGVITRAKLRITEPPLLSIDIFKFTELSELLGKVRVLKKDIEVYFLEFLDKKTSQALGFGNNYVLLVAYTTLKGKKRNLLEVRRLCELLDSVHSLLRRKGYYYLQDPYVSLEKSYDLIEWCEKNKVGLHGHISIGLFYAYFLKEDKDLIKTFKSFIKRINGCLGIGFGFGSMNKDFISPSQKKELMKLKEEYDYNNILNPNKAISYR